MGRKDHVNQAIVIRHTAETMLFSGRKSDTTAPICKEMGESVMRFYSKLTTLDFCEWEYFP